MAVYGAQTNESFLAAGDLSGLQYGFVLFSAARTVNIATAATVETFAGVLQNKPNAAGKAASVCVAGETKITAGGSVTVNDLITTNSSGRATAASSGDFVLGRALEAAGSDGEVIAMMLSPFFYGGDLA